MREYGHIFKRTEKKYLITEEKRSQLLKAIGDRLEKDSHGDSTICNIYFDTRDFRLIRASMEKPTVYKEKLRLRCYGETEDESSCFVEMKKKYKGTVYKRRVKMSYKQAFEWLTEGKTPCENSQIIREIEAFLSFYENLYPAAALFYDRQAFYCKRDTELRITFDSNIRCRSTDVDLRRGCDGKAIFKDNEYIMEIKSPAAMPLWLTRELDRFGIYPCSFSKYAAAYKRDFLYKA